MTYGGFKGVLNGWRLYAGLRVLLNMRSDVKRSDDFDLGRAERGKAGSKRVAWHLRRFENIASA